MTEKLAFQLTAADAPNRYSIRLLDKKQIAALALAEGFAKPIPLDPIVVIYDEGSGELVPVDGFDHATARGRIAMKILADVYCDALDRIMTGAAVYASSGQEACRNEPGVFRF